MKTLVLAGTTFLGRHLVRALIDRGHETAMFTRGKRRGDETVAIARYVGDREGDLRALPREGWDAVIDTSGYVPGIVAASCAHLATAGRYFFTSSISVYDATVAAIGDGHAPYAPRNVHLADADPENYGSSKRRSEDVVRAVFDDRAILVRPGLLVGPHDPTKSLHVLGRSFRRWRGRRRARAGRPSHPIHRYTRRGCIHDYAS